MDVSELPSEGELLLATREDLAPSLGDFELVADIWAADARAARYAAELAGAVAALARRRHIQRDAEFGHRGGPGHDSRLRRHQALAEVSETFVPELAMIRNCSEAEAETLALESILLTTKLRGTWHALYEGRLDVRKMRALVDLLAPVRQTVVDRIEQQVLPAAETLTVPLLRQRVRRLIAKLDAEALDKRREEAARHANVTHRPTGDGLGQVVIDLPVAQSAACVDAIDQYAQMLRADGDTRPIGVIRAAVAADLILRPWDTSRPSVTAKLVVHVPLSSLRHPSGRPQPAAEIAGEVVTAAECRELLQRLGMLGVDAAPAGGSVHLAIGDPSAGLVALASPRELERGAGGRDGCRGPGLRAPRTAPGYRPAAEQRRFVEVRDRHCRMPGCRRRPGRLDLDHVVSHADGGATTCENLCCLCRRHHRIKTFASGWHFELLDDGRLIVRTPSGVSRTTVPPGWCFDAEPDPPWLDETAPPDPMRC
ncbi:HNH endonuclease signature motif containing protein [Blastococcus sp. TF02A_35]|uniref:HNH endonuclease signature motif containing protein n=1 Tax=Blastococcus sp. TF02A-35 TaxID=2559612 RepID=UPI0010740ADC|nr:HNH endonuclease signature motif containing protein [Blastococcus sp. TF02A_35]TFV47794.1 HNH endonuclease [Blastococcus sp. TF02A_35]